MKATIISKTEMSNIVALCAATGAKINLHDNGDSISAVIPSWRREYEAFFDGSTTPVIKAYIGVLLRAKGIKGNRKSHRK